MGAAIAPSARKQVTQNLFVIPLLGIAEQLPRGTSDFESLNPRQSRCQDTFPVFRKVFIVMRNVEPAPARSAAPFSFSKSFEEPTRDGGRRETVYGSSSEAR